MKLSDYDARILTDSKEVADYFLEVTKHTQNFKAAANWTMGAVKGWVNTQASHITEFPLSPSKIAEVIEQIDSGRINYSVAEQKLFPLMLDHPNEGVADLVDQNNLALQGDDGYLESLVMEVLEEFPDKVEAYKNGKTGLLGMFMGQIMKRSGGKADPQEDQSTFGQGPKQLIWHFNCLYY